MNALQKKLEEFIDSLALPNFRGREFTPYWSRYRGGVTNSTPSETLWLNIVPTLVVLQDVRTELGQPIQLLSTFRNPAYNKAVGGETNSFHMKFQAIDCTTNNLSMIDFGQMFSQRRGRTFKNPLGGKFIFAGGIGIYTKNGFVHVDTRGYNANWIEK